MGARIAHGFHQLFDNMLRCRQIGVSHAEINNVFTLCPRLRFQLIDTLENVRRQSLNAGKFLTHLSVSFWPCVPQDCGLSKALAYG